MTTQAMDVRSQFTSVESAIKRIPRGRRMLIGSGAAEPQVLVHGLVDHKEHFADNDIVHLLTLGPAPYVQPGMQSHFRHTAFFIGANVREAVQEGRADFMPVFLSSESGRAAFIPINRGADFFDRYRHAPESQTVSPTTRNNYSVGAMQCAMRPTE